MPRRSGVPKRDVLPDPVYNSKVVAKLINQVMLDGKKGTAQAIVYEAFDMVAEKLGGDALDIFAIRWMVMYARNRGENNMNEKLAGEIMDAYNNTGASIKKKEEMHRMAEANKAFAHYRW